MPLAAPASVVDALFQQRNGQQEEATGMPASKRSRGGEDDDGDENRAAAFDLFTVIKCDDRLRELTRALPYRDDPDTPIEPAFRGLSADDEPIFRGLSAEDDDEPPRAFNSLGTDASVKRPITTGSVPGEGNEVRRAEYARYVAREPMVTAERNRVLDLRERALGSLRVIFGPAQLQDPIFRPYDLEREFAVYQRQMAPLDDGMARLGIRSPLPMDTNPPPPSPAPA